MSCALEVTPETALTFVLNRGNGSGDDGTARCIMELKHPGKDGHIAFKVKTTQPRRYLVRPNQGIVSPGKSENITILLVERDKQMLLQAFDRLGQSALDNSKDKFLVQSCMVDDETAESYYAKKERMAKIPDEASRIGRELSESLAGIFGGTQIFNKKLQVKHIVSSEGEGAQQVTPRDNGPPQGDVGKMSSDEMFTEITSLRRKYDELVTFSVNLTAERDILNNTLEQTKRDLSRESFRTRELTDQLGDAQTGQPIPGRSGFSIFTFLIFIFVGALFFLIGVKAKHLDAVGFLFDVPVLGDVLRAEL